MIVILSFPPPKLNLIICCRILALYGLAKSQTVVALNLHVFFWKISHIIREIRQFQQTSYRIEHQQKVRLLPATEIGLWQQLFVRYSCHWKLKCVSSAPTHGEEDRQTCGRVLGAVRPLPCRDSLFDVKKFFAPLEGLWALQSSRCEGFRGRCVLPALGSWDEGQDTPQAPAEASCNSFSLCSSREWRSLAKGGQCLQRRFISDSRIVAWAEITWQRICLFLRGINPN